MYSIAAYGYGNSRPEMLAKLVEKQTRMADGNLRYRRAAAGGKEQRHRGDLPCPSLPDKGQCQLPSLFGGASICRDRDSRLIGKNLSAGRPFLRARLAFLPFQQPCG